jgi:hypothetical protein
MPCPGDPERAAICHEDHGSAAIPPENVETEADRPEPPVETETPAVICPRELNDPSPVSESLAKLLGQSVPDLRSMQAN